LGKKRDPNNGQKMCCALLNTALTGRKHDSTGRGRGGGGGGLSRVPPLFFDVACARRNHHHQREEETTLMGVLLCESLFSSEDSRR